MFVRVFVCLFVCLSLSGCHLDYSKSYERILIKIFRRVEGGSVAQIPIE